MKSLAQVAHIDTCESTRERKSGSPRRKPIGADAKATTTRGPGPADDAGVPPVSGIKPAKGTASAREPHERRRATTRGKDQSFAGQVARRPEPVLWVAEHRAEGTRRCMTHLGRRIKATALAVVGSIVSVAIRFPRSHPHEIDRRRRELGLLDGVEPPRSRGARLERPASDEPPRTSATSSDDALLR